MAEVLTEPCPGRSYRKTARHCNSILLPSFPQEQINLLSLLSCSLWSCVMTPAERIEKAFDDAHVVIGDYLQPGPRNAEDTLNQLIRVIDDRELYRDATGKVRVPGRTPGACENSRLCTCPRAGLSRTESFDPPRGVCAGRYSPPSHRKRRSLGPLIALFVPGYFIRCSPTSWSRSAHNSSTFNSIRASSSSADLVGMPAR